MKATDFLKMHVRMVAFVAVLMTPSLLLALPVSDAIEQAMRIELKRSMAGLRLDDLPGPYFIQYEVEDGVSYSITATYGGIIVDAVKRSRTFRSRVRVGSYELDNTNVGFGGDRTSLPLDDDVKAIRQTIWLATDIDYKRAVEILTRKQAYLRDKTMEDRPADFTPYEAVVHEEPAEVLTFDRSEWTERAKQLSAVFKKHPLIQNASVNFFTGQANSYLLNTEGSRIRTSDTGAILEIGAEIQAADGMRLADSLSYLAYQPAGLPGIDAIVSAIETMCTNLESASKAPILDEYTGPVLFDASASGSMFEALLGAGLAARPQPLGSSRSSEESLEKKLGRRILPRTFQVYDDPRIEFFHGKLLAGMYEYDDEAVPAGRVDLVKNGVLKNMLASRAPTKKVKQTTGHARGGNRGEPRAHIGCLFISDSDAISDDQLMTELREAADEEGLAFGLRVAKLRRGGRNRLGSPIQAYRVSVADGSEELIRGVSFLPTPTRALKRILAAGNKPELFNAMVPISSSIISPSILFEELELRKMQEEFDKPPILQSPLARRKKPAANRN